MKKNIIRNGTNPIMGVNYRQNPVSLKKTDGSDRNENQVYSDFVKLGKTVFFTDEQIDFLWDYMEWLTLKEPNSN